MTRSLLPAFLFTVILAVGALSSPATAQDTPDQPASDPLVMRVVPIQFAEAGPLMSTVRNLVRANIAVDERTNSLVISARRSELDSVLELVATLDQPVPAASSDKEELVRVWTLEHAIANQKLADTLIAIFNFPQQSRSGAVSNARTARIAYDAATNQVIASGRTSALDALDVVIEAIDRPAVTTAGGDRRLRLVWLLGGLPEGDGLAVPRDLEGVIAELGQLGIVDLRRAAQTIVGITGGETFESDFVTAPGGPWEVRVEGYAAPGESGGEKLTISIKVARDDGVSSALMTTISTVPGHFVVLGASPLEGLESVFVVQITE
jgi:hypothetical protein